MLSCFERETTAAGCLVDILSSLRTNPNNEVQNFWLWASVLKEVQNGTKSGSPIVEFWRDFGENIEIYGNNRTKLCRQKVAYKRHFNA